MRWLLGAASPQAEADGATDWYGYIADITDPRELLAARRNKAAAERIEADQLALHWEAVDLAALVDECLAMLQAQAAEAGTSLQSELRAGQVALDVIGIGIDIGLAVSRSLLELMGGRLALSSILGEGSLLSVVLSV